MSTKSIKILIFIPVLFNAKRALTFSASHSFDVLPFNLPTDKKKAIYFKVFP